MFNNTVRPNQLLVAHTCNYSYSGGRDQEDHSSKSELGKSFARLYLEKIQHKKRADGVEHCLAST
jgi:hypothetical protein